MSTQFDRNKILAHLPVINEYVYSGHVDSPLLVEIDLTNVCNHDCPGCTGFRQEGGLNSYIVTQDAKRIISEISGSGTRSVTFTGGGDPTMHKDFAEIIEFAKSQGLEVGLITNGLALKEKHLEKIVSSCTWIRVSWDAATPELHEKIHYNGDVGIPMRSVEQFWKVVQNTAMLCNYKKTHDLSCTIGCAFLVDERTQHEIVPFAELAAKTGVDYCQYRPFHYSSYNLESETMMAYAREKYQTETFSVLFSEFKFRSMKDKDIKRSYDRCHGSHFSTHVAANYNVYVCCHLMFHPAACIGNLKEESFQKIWRSNKKIDVINKIDVHKCLPLCRHDSANRILDVIVTSEKIKHRNFI